MSKPRTFQDKNQQQQTPAPKQAPTAAPQQAPAPEPTPAPAPQDIPAPDDGAIIPTENIVIGDEGTKSEITDVVRNPDGSLTVEVSKVEDGANGLNAQAFDKVEAVQEQTDPEVPPLTQLERLRAEAQTSTFLELRSLVEVYDNYVKEMRPGAMTNGPAIARNNASFWRATRSVLKSKDAFAPGIRLIMAYFREYKSGALQDVMMMRGLFDVEHNRMSTHIREAFRNIVSLLTAAASLESVKQTSNVIDLGVCLKATDLDKAEQNRVIAFFS